MPGRDLENSLGLAELLIQTRKPQIGENLAPFGSKAGELPRTYYSKDDDGGQRFAISWLSWHVLLGAWRGPSLLRSV